MLEETAAHEAAAVGEAVAAERMRCILRFTSLLQVRLAAVMACRAVAGAAHVLCACHRTARQPANRMPRTPSPSRVQGSALGAELLSSQGLAGAPLQPQRFPQGAPTLPSFPGFLTTSAKMAGAAAGAAAQPPPQPAPLSSSPPFCCSALGAHLRGEYAGGASAFVQPAAEEPADELDALVPLPAELI